MSLQRRLLLYLLLCAPLVWAVASYFSIGRARHEVNELFDTELIRLAYQAQTTLQGGRGGDAPATRPPPAEGSPEAGDSDVRDLAIAVWDAGGQLLLHDREGARLPRRADASGFAELQIDGEPWRVYYLLVANGRGQVAAGQKVEERDEVVFDLTASQLTPWLLVLPVLLAAMALAVRRALKPVRRLAAELQQREADDLRPVPPEHAPQELKPLVAALNGLFLRIEETLARERRFTADAAHELRTPLAVLRAQWDVVSHASSEAERAATQAKLAAGLERMERLVTQMLLLSRLEAGPASLPDRADVHWPTIVEQAISDCLPLAERRAIEIACEWPAPPRHPLPLRGDAHLLTVMLRNLLDNAVRYAPQGSQVTLRFGEDELLLDNDGPPLAPESLAQLGQRFHRPDGQLESGSGLGLSIVLRIAALHELRPSFGPRPDGHGLRVALRFETAALSPRAGAP